jgi:hypothetical protein
MTLEISANHPILIIWIFMRVTFRSAKHVIVAILGSVIRHNGIVSRIFWHVLMKVFRCYSYKLPNESQV